MRRGERWLFRIGLAVLVAWLWLCGWIVFRTASGYPVAL